MSKCMRGLLVHVLRRLNYCVNDHICVVFFPYTARVSFSFVLSCQKAELSWFSYMYYCVCILVHMKLWLQQEQETISIKRPLIRNLAGGLSDKGKPAVCVVVVTVTAPQSVISIQLISLLNNDRVKKVRSNTDYHKTNVCFSTKSIILFIKRAGRRHQKRILLDFVVNNTTHRSINLWVDCTTSDW